MKKTFKTLAAAGLLLLTAATSQAQINLKSISVGAGYWQPSLDYWNNNSILREYNNGAGEQFGGAVTPTVALEVGLFKGLSIGGRVSSWRKSVSSPVSIAGINRTEELTLSILPVAVDLKYTLGKTGGDKQPFLTPYVGVSAARYFITNQFSRTVVGNPGSVDETQAGNTYGFQLFAGAEKQLVKKLYLGLDVRYHLGNYKQSVATVTGSGATAVTTTRSETVSLNGVEAGLSLRFKFN